MALHGAAVQIATKQPAPAATLPALSPARPGPAPSFVDGNLPVIWAKTEAGRTEIQARALVKERAQRNLLLVVDGAKTEEALIATITGLKASDFAVLQSLGLIAPVQTGGSARPSGVSGPRGNTVPPSVEAPAPAIEGAPLNYAQFTETLTKLISKELGLRGFVLTLAVEKASTIEELQAVAQRTLAQITERKGDAVAAAARRSLYGG
jgi:hypothetical protein